MTTKEEIKDYNLLDLDNLVISAENLRGRVWTNVRKYDAEYASQVMDKIPLGYINKSICGCGLTTVAIENGVPTIIAVPTINLVLNKVSQYPNERSDIKVLGVYGDTVFEDILNYVDERNYKGEPIKILVTYDSLPKVEYLMAKYSDTVLVVDESNRLLTTTELKTSSKESSKSTDAISRLMDIARTYKDRVSFISATPIPLEYMPDWVSTLPQIKLEWENTIKATPYIMERGFVAKALREEIILPLLDNNSIEIEDLKFSKAVIFINSVTAINELIKKCNIPLNDVRVVVGDSLTNALKLPKRIERLDYEENRRTGKLSKFTFITSSAFDGIDLYDDDAISIVVSNSTKDFQMLDIATDLKQAIARIRTKSNPNYGKYIYLYNQSVFDKTEEELLENIDKTSKKIDAAISNYDLIKVRGDLTGWMEDEDFIGYTIYNEEYDAYKKNSMRFEADKYFLLEVRSQYKVGFDMRGCLDNHIEVETVEIDYIEFSDLVKHFNDTEDKNNIDWGRYSAKKSWIELIEKTFRVVGKVDTNYGRCVEALEAKESTPTALNNEIRRTFSTGRTYTRKEVKDNLQRIYDRLKINRRAKWNDLDDVMKVRHKKITGERVIEVLSK